MISLHKPAKLANLIREEVARILNRDITFPAHALVTVTRVVLSSDKYYATVFISIIQANSQEILTLLDEEIYMIQHAFNKRLRMRPVPKIRFKLDREEVLRENIEASLAKLKQEEHDE